MQVVNPPSNVTRGSGLMKEQSFGIADAAFILDIIRSKIYSNPVRTICQEIMSNARDAHREMGKDDTPIEVQLPNSLDPHYIVRDFGPGITPDRMKNVYTQYGASTKRDDNVQTGGFGIGAKTPWAYADQFGIISITPEDVFIDSDGELRENVLVKRTYSAYIDETRMGRIALMDESVTDEPQGTAIVLAVKINDYDKFAKWTKHSADYWDTRPVITGNSNFSWTNLEMEFEGDDWLVLKKTSYDYEFNRPIAIVDGIPYPINESSLDFTDNDIHRLFDYPARLYFKTGDIYLTANREEIDYARTNKANLVKRLSDVIDGIRRQMQAHITNCKNLWEANVTWRKAKEGYCRIINEVKWNGLPVTGDPLILGRLGFDTWWFTRNEDRAKRARTDNGVIEFNAKDMLVFDDTTDNSPSRARALTLLNNNPDIQRIQVVRYPKSDATRADAMKTIEDQHNWSKLNALSFKTVEKARIRRARGTKTVVKIKEYCRNAKPKFSWADTEIDLEDDSVGGAYVLLDRYDISLQNGNSYSTHVLSDISYALGDITIYGIPKSILKKIAQKDEDGTALNDNWVPLENLIEAKLDELLQDAGLVKCLDNSEYTCYSMSRNNYSLWNVMESQVAGFVVEDSESLLMQYYKLSKAINDQEINIKKYNILNRVINKPMPKAAKNDSLYLMYNTARKRYPLICGGYANSSVNECSPSHLAAYINMCDKAAKENLTERKQDAV